ncbi:hypothetical protein K7I13_06310 [Brucepastera parasyntrophica]|uniref:hypothetical protein n=1 Tax=Brucepastera parasyntrophica TaxID=2880008 RepID=UPI00210D1F19|nr:hypothetical protein [Brucepastera parasyntrophica]ULQ60874.1 hypothetical protein K7I13_06310 [Brucepastera parasyntrophica]
MKKIMTFLLAGLLLVSLIGCSGDLHDSNEHTGTTGDWGYWWSIAIDTTGVAADGTVSVIFKNDNKQSSDITGAPLTGSVYYEFDSGTGTVIPNTRGDNPASTAGAGELFVAVYTQLNPVHLHAWGSDGYPITGAWASAPLMTSSAPPPDLDNYTMVIKVINATGGATVFLNGTVWGWDTWPFTAWGPSAADVAEVIATQSARFLVANAGGETNTVTKVVTSPQGTPYSGEIMVVECTPVGSPPTDYTVDSQSGNIPVSLGSGPGTYDVTITYAAGGGTAVVSKQ